MHGQLASYEKEIIQYHSSMRKEKLDVFTQTTDLDIPSERFDHIISFTFNNQLFPILTSITGKSLLMNFV